MSEFVVIPGERLSAVAKRRRLNGSPAVPSPSSTSTNGLSRAPSLSPNHSASEENAFSALADNKIVSYGVAKEVATVSPEAVVIRLSKGEKCQINGVYRIWLREGAVTLNGAQLSFLTGKKIVFAPETYDTPSIVGQSESPAEFEIQNVGGSFRPVFNNNHYYWTTPKSSPMPRSFTIHGLSDPSTHVRQPRELDVGATLAARKDVTTFIQSSTETPIIVFCGTRVPGTSLHVSSFINGLFSISEPDKLQKYPRGFYLLDLDSAMPEFGPPGTISLVRITEQIFGPSFTHPAIYGRTAHRMVAMKWVGNTAAAVTRKQLYLKLVEFAMEIDLKGKPLLVKAWDWFGHLTAEDIDNVAKILHPTHVLSFRAKGSSSNDYFGSQLAVLAKATYTDIFLPTGLEPSSIDQHKKSMQSYFFARQELPNEVPQWYYKPTDLGLDEPPALWLQHNAGNQPGDLSAIWVGDGMTPRDDLPRKLYGAMIAIVSDPGESVLLPQSNPKPDNSEDIYTIFSGVEDDIHHSVEHVEIRRAPENNLPCIWYTKDVLRDNKCLGLGIICDVNLADDTIAIRTPVHPDMFRFAASLGARFHFHIIMPDAYGRFSTLGLINASRERK